MARPPLPPFTRRPPPRRRAWPRTPGIRAIPNACRSPIPRTAAGAIAPKFRGPHRDRRVPHPKMGEGTRIPADQGSLGVRRNRIAVRFQYEWHDDAGNWYRSYGNEQWEFDEHGLMRRREASINDVRSPRKTGDFTGPHPDLARRTCQARSESPL